MDIAPEGTVFHTSLWLQASTWPYVIYGVFRAEELVGGAAIAWRKVGPFRVAGHPPLTPYLGTVISPSKGKYVTNLSSRKEVSTAIAKQLRKLFHHGALNMAPEIVDLQPFIWNGFSVGVRYTYRLSLDDLSATWADMGATRRNDIRRAEADGLWVDREPGIDEVLSLVEDTFTRQGMTASFAEAARRYHRAVEAVGRCRGFVTRDRAGRRLAAAYIVWDSKRAYYLLGGYATGSRHHGAGPLALWEAMRFTREILHLREFDLEGSMVPAIEQYFRKFGGRLVPYYTTSWTRPAVRYGLTFGHSVGRAIKGARGLSFKCLSALSRRPSIQ